MMVDGMCVMIIDFDLSEMIVLCIHLGEIFNTIIIVFFQLCIMPEIKMHVHLQRKRVTILFVLISIAQIAICGNRQCLFFLFWLHLHGLIVQF